MAHFKKFKFLACSVIEDSTTFPSTAKNDIVLFYVERFIVNSHFSRARHDDEDFLDSLPTKDPSEVPAGSTR